MALAPIPAVPDAERRTRYVLTAPTSSTMEVGFDIWASGSDYSNWAEVWQDGVKLPTSNWSMTSPSGPLADLPRPIINAVIKPLVPFSGTIDIVGAERPRRPIQFVEGVGVPARDHNRTYNDHTAIDREFWDIFRRTLRGAPGEDINPIPPVLTRATKALGFDSAGHPIVTDSTVGEIDDAVDLIKILEGILAGLQKGNPNIVVLASVAALRLISTATVTATAAIVQAYSVAGDDGGGVFQVDVDDTTSLDDNGLIILDASGRRWKRIIGTYATKHMFGVLPEASYVNVAAYWVALSAVAQACWKQRVPLYLAEGVATVEIYLMTETDNNSIARGKLMEQATDWQQGCATGNNAVIELFFRRVGIGPMSVTGQIRVGDFGSIDAVGGKDIEGGDSAHTLNMKMELPSFIPISKTGADDIKFSQTTERIAYVDLPYEGWRGGPTYTVPPVVTFIGATSVGATAYLWGAEDGNFLTPPLGVPKAGKLKSIAITGSQGQVTAPEVNGKWPDLFVVLDGVTADTIAAGVVPVVASDISQVTIKLAWPNTSTPDPNDQIPLTEDQWNALGIQTWMPVGFTGVEGTNDCAILNGASYIITFDEVAQTITVPWPCPAALHSVGPEEGQPSAGLVVFPKNWIQQEGGYDGTFNGLNGFLSVNGNGRLCVRHWFMRWHDNQYQDRKGKSGGIGSHTEGFVQTSDDTIIVGFPERQLRLGGSGFINWLYAGCAYTGNEGVLFQVGGAVSFAKSAVGGCRGECVTYNAVSGFVADVQIGSGVKGLVSSGGYSTSDGVRIAGCVQGLYAMQGGLMTSVQDHIYRCDIGVDWEGGGKIIQGLPQFGSVTEILADLPNHVEYRPAGTANTKNVRNDYEIDTAVFGGGYFGTTSGPPVIHTRGFTADSTPDTIAAPGPITIDAQFCVITITAISIAANTTASFVLTNSKAKTTDIIRVDRVGGTNATGDLAFWGTRGAVAGQHTINIRNHTGAATATGQLILAVELINTV